MSKKRFKLSEKQRQNRINRFISKYGYDPRSSYRPKKTGVRGRPVKTMPFSKSLVKSANERLGEANVSIAEDSVTNLAVNGNSTALNQLSREVVAALTSQISVDSDRICSISRLLEEKDRALAGVRK